MSTLNKIRNLIRKSVITNPSKDSGQYQIAQIGNNSRTYQVRILSNYGHCFNAPIGSTVTAMNISGDDGEKVAIVNLDEQRFRGLAIGEVRDGNFLTRANIYYKANGDIEITAVGNVIINASNATVNADQVDINAPLTTMSGDLEVSGDITAFKGSPNEISLDTFGTTYNSHTHDETGSVTDVPNPLI